MQIKLIFMFNLMKIDFVYEKMSTKTRPTQGNSEMAY